jgi:hypothetical protein
LRKKRRGGKEGELRATFLEGAEYGVGGREKQTMVEKKPEAEKKSVGDRLGAEGEAGCP